jgi:hypothetical protein
VTVVVVVEVVVEVSPPAHVCAREVTVAVMVVEAVMKVVVEVSPLCARK